MWAKVGGVIALVSAIVGLVTMGINLTYYFAERDVHAGDIAKQVASLKVEVDSQASKLQQIQNNLIINTSALNENQKEEKVLRNKIHTISSNTLILSQSIKSIYKQVAELSTKVHAANPKEQKCAELAEQVDTGQRDNGGMSVGGQDIINSAIAAMKELGCGSTAIGP